MTATKTAVTDTATTILSGSQTTNTLVLFTLPVSICGGATTGFSHDIGFPIDFNTPLVWPPNLALTAIAGAGKTGLAFTTVFGV